MQLTPFCKPMGRVSVMKPSSKPCLGLLGAKVNGLKVEEELAKKSAPKVARRCNDHHRARW